MANIKLPQARHSAAPQPKRREIPIQAILQTMGSNPIAEGLADLGPILSQALAKRQEIRRRAQQVGQIENTYGLPQGQLSELSPEMAAGVGRSVYDREQATNKAGANAAAIRLLEKQAGVPAGSYGDDPTTARFMFAQKTTKDRADSNDTERERNRGLRVDKTVLDWMGKMRGDPEIKPLYGQKIGLSQIDDLVDIAKSGNTVAATALGTKAARAMGEVGVLTDSDVTRYVQSGRLDRKAADVLSRWIQGKPTDATLNEISQISSVIKDRFQSNVQPVYNQYIEVLARNLDMTPDEAAFKLGVQYSPRSKEKDLQPIRPVAPQLQMPGGSKRATMRWNPQTGRVEPVQ